MATSLDAVVTGLGLASSVGAAAGGAAAIRAGIGRPQESSASVEPEQGPEALPVTCHPARGCPEGSWFPGRWIHLASAALRDLLTTSSMMDSVGAASWGRTGLFVAVPDGLQRRYPQPTAIDDAYLIEHYATRLAASVALPIDRSNARVCRKGHAGAIDAMRLAIDDLRTGHFERAIIVGCDSQVDSGSMDWLHREGLLKTADRPIGLIPGEAAACFALEAQTTATGRAARILATVSSVVVAHTPVNPETRSGAGEAHARVIAASLQQARAGTPFQGDLYCDLNGTVHRAQDHGESRHRLGAILGDRVHIQTPCSVIGDTGAASSAIAVILGTTSLARGHASDSTVLITARSEEGHVAAACLRHAEPPKDES